MAPNGCRGEAPPVIHILAKPGGDGEKLEGRQSSMAPNGCRGEAPPVIHILAKPSGDRKKQVRIGKKRGPQAGPFSFLSTTVDSLLGASLGND